MKHIIIAACAIVAICTFSCTNSGKAKLQAALEQVNSECPVDLGDEGIFERVRYDNDNNSAVFTYVINEDAVSISNLEAINREQKTFLGSFLRSEANRDLLNILVDADASLTYVLRGRTSGDSILVTLSPDELSNIASRSDENNSLSQLESIVAITNHQCPSVVDDGLTLKSAVIVNDYITFDYEYDTSIITIPLENVAELREATKEILREELTTVTGQSQLKLMKECKIGTRYIYTPTTTDVSPIVISITPEEVAEF